MPRYCFACSCRIKSPLTASQSNAPSTAAEEAEVASRGAAEASKKAEAAKSASEALATDAAKWMAGGELPPAPQSTAATAPPTAESSRTVIAGASGSDAAQSSSAATAGSQPIAPSATTSNALLLPLPTKLPRPLVIAAHALWRQLEGSYLEGLALGFKGIRATRQLALAHVASACRGFKAFLSRPDNKQALVAAFVERFNAVEPDVRVTREAQVGGGDGDDYGLILGFKRAACLPDRAGRLKNTALFHISQTYRTH